MNDNTSHGSPVRMAILLVLHTVCGLIIFWLLLKFVPQHEKIFRDFNTKLPDMTLLVLNLSRVFGRYWYLLIPGPVAGDIALMVVLNRCAPRLMTAWGILFWLAQILLIGLIMLAIIVPMTALIENLSR